MSSEASRSGLVLELAEEFLERYRRGERPSLKEYIDRRPDLAVEIKEVFPAMAMMENIALADESFDQTAVPTAQVREPLRQVGDCRIIREVGRGGMGIVYEAEQVSLGRHVALKVLPEKMLLDERSKRRFEREAKAAAKLHHTNIVPVFGVGEHDGLPYYFMQFIQGLGLNDVLEELKRLPPGGNALALEPTAPEQRPSVHDLSAANAARSLLAGPFDAARNPNREPAEWSSEALPGSSSVSLPGPRKANYWHSVATVGAQVAAALEHAHGQGVIHRDVKPSNLLLDQRGNVWVTDFGLAKTDDQENLTAAGDVLGTLRYMPPEAFDGRADARGDVYSLGLTLYELLALRPAFDEQDHRRLIHQVTTQEPARLGKLNPRVPRDLETIVHKAIDREPGRRYQTAADLAADLQRFVDDQPIQARHISAAERAWRWCRRRPAVAGLLAALAAVIVGSLAGLTALWLQADERRRQAEAARGEETKAKVLAQENFEEARLNLYISNTQLAHRAWHEGNVARVRELLDGPPLREAANVRRGFEWGYLDRLCHTELLSLEEKNSTKVAYSPDGRWLASAGNGPIRIREAATGRLVHTLPGEGKQRGYKMAFSPDSRLLASAHHDQEIRLWDVESWQDLPLARPPSPIKSGQLTPDSQPVPTKHGMVSGLAFSPDGQLLAVTEGSYVQVFDRTSGKEIAAFPSVSGGTLLARAVAFHPDGGQVAAVGGGLKVWDLTANRLLFDVPGRATAVQSVAYSPDGRRLAWADNAGVKVHDAQTGTLLVSWEAILDEQTGYPAKVAFSAAGRRLATAEGKLIRVWDTATWKEEFSLKGHTGSVWQVAFHPDGRRLASVSDDGTLKVWQVPGAQERSLFTVRKNAVRTFSPDGRRYAEIGATRADGRLIWFLSVQDSMTGVEIVRCAGHSDDRVFHPMGFSPDGRFLAAVSRPELPPGQPGQVMVWDALTGRRLHGLKGHKAMVRQIVFSPDGRYLLTVDTGGFHNLWEVETAKLVRSRTLPFPTWSLVFSPDGRRLAYPSQANGVPEIRIEEAVSEIQLLSIPLPRSGGSPPELALAFSPDGRRLAFKADTIQIADAETGQVLLSLGGHERWVPALAFSPDGSRLASAHHGGFHAGEVRIWETRTGQELLTLKAVRGQIRNLAFTNEGRRLCLLVGGNPDVIIFWDAAPLPAEEIIQRDALELIATLFEKHPLRAEAVEALQQTRLTADLRQAAEDLVAKYPEDAGRLNEASWLIVREPGASPEAYGRALRMAEQAGRLVPGPGASLTTLGAAQYRLGQFQKERYPEALATLAKCDQKQPLTLAFLAMTQHQLGQREMARTTLTRAREGLKDPPGAGNADAGEVLREAVELIEGQGK